MFPQSTEKHDVRIMRISIVPKGEQLFHEGVTHIAIEDECGGEFVTIEQNCERQKAIGIDPEEWPAIRNAIEFMMGECRIVAK